ncbi:hypothetical protein PVL29_014793 [Vitis rotundifolia]|uniref:TIR domain-containing protein n=1 Tax=Vitis rotundifolia TaxID=103349 RepID=A0AA38ZHP9_VITRO|nr:hypothetical protein PVL29_014793 [Vitis rotundifolia]
MAFTSTQIVSFSSTSIPRWNHDVFLSFRGEDTRYSFTDHLYTSLVRRGIRTFRDDKLKRGEEIGSELLKAIEESRFSVIIFSPKYAHSRWCLDELLKIMECRKEMGQTVLPVFHHVDPSHVRKQTGSFGEAFDNHKAETEEKKEKVQRWRTALTEAANLAGEDVNDGYETMYIKKITEFIFRRLNRGLLHVGKNLVGMDSHLKEMTSRLGIGLDDVRMVGICGFGGIGKTTIAKVVYNQISHQYEGTSFLLNVREASKDHHGLVKLQKQLLDDILVEETQIISNVDQGANMIQNCLRFKRILMVLDDVDDLGQLEYLAGDHDWFGRGSRIIITTRDKHLLNVHRVNDLYEVEGLKDKEALELFSRYAFGQILPRHDYKNLSGHIVYYCQGLPLALKVLGSLLCRKTIPQWKSELHKLEREPETKIQNVLKISFDGLDHIQKKIFLDIACFFKGENKDFVSRILDDFYVDIGMQVLQDLCLLTISNNKIYMHDLIQQMGWEIVRKEFPDEPEKWSRLWDPNDVKRAFATNEEMKNTEGIFLDLSKIKHIQFSTKAFAKMKKLRLLKAYWKDHYGSMKKEYKLLLPQDFEFPSYDLRYLHLEGYSLKSLPSNFYGENLVEINLKGSNIRELWQGSKCLQKLKVLNLSKSEQLIEIPNFSNMPNLEKLHLENCRGLNKIDPSIGVLKKLTRLNLGGCQNLRSLPISIESLDSIEVLHLNETAIEELPSSIDHLTALAELYMRKCKNLRSLPTSIWRLKSLQELYLDGCSNLEALPEIMEDMKNVDDLGLAKMATNEFTSSIQNLKVLYASGCSKLEKFRFLKGLFSLVTLDLSNQDLMDGAIPSDLWCLSSLEYLNLSKNNICHIPVAITQLCKLEKLNISHCKLLQEIPQLPSSLKRIDAHDCTGLETLSSPSSLLWCSLLQWFQSTRLQVCNIFDIGMHLDFLCTHKIYMLP